MKKTRKNILLFLAGTAVVAILALFKDKALYLLDNIFNKEVPLVSTTGSLMYIVFLSAIEFVIAAFTIAGNVIKRFPLKKCAAIYLLTVLLMLNYNFDIFSTNNTMFGGFQADSESLVAASFTAEKLGLDDKHNLGNYRNILNNSNVELRGQAYYDYAFTPYSDSEITDGYSVTQAGVMAVGKGDLAREVFAQGRTVRFADGTECTVLSQEEKDNCIYVHTDCDKLLTQDKNGKLIDITVFDENGNSVLLHEYTKYKSQFGLQGLVFRYGAKFLPLNLAYALYYLLCSGLAAVCFMGITVLIAKRYNIVMAASFYIVFWVSPTIVNYARNLYWVEFTWFIPMAVGILCAAYFENRIVRLISYIGAFASIFIKCLCGYEYISAILVSMMMFLFADFVKLCINKDAQKAIEYFKTMVILALAGLAGFTVAIAVHAASLDMGSMSESIKYIWEFVIRKRTSGINQPFSAISGMEVIKTYMSFDLDIVNGIYGTHFKKMMIVPIAVFIAEIVCYKKVDWRNVTLYVLGFAAAASWYLIAKEHSALHFYMNIVLWYFGFVQMCIYIPLNFVAGLLPWNRNN